MTAVCAVLILFVCPLLGISSAWSVWRMSFPRWLSALIVGIAIATGFMKLVEDAAVHFGWAPQNVVDRHERSKLCE